MKTPKEWADKFFAAHGIDVTAERLLTDVIRRAIAEAVAEEREACILAACENCRAGYEVVLVGTFDDGEVIGYQHVMPPLHTHGATVWCSASAIRARGTTDGTTDAGPETKKAG